MYDRVDLLFSKYDLFSGVDGQLKQAEKAVAALPPNTILNTDAETLAARLAAEHAIRVPRLARDQAHLEQEEIQIDVRDDWRRAVWDRSQPALVPGFRMTLVVPYDGDETLFYCRPSQFTLSPPRAVVETGRLLLFREVEHIEPQQMKESFDRELAEIEQWLGWIDSQVRPGNESLPGRIRQFIEHRREELKKAQDAVAAIGFPVRKAPGRPQTYAAPEVQRRPSPAMPTLVQPNPLEPALVQEHYEHILTVVKNLATSMERTPAAFSRLEEEHLRDHILSHLNGHYAGSATGETFNRKGKTDIIVRSQNENIFIAECKIWEGAVAFSHAIDQLRGYLGWRDRKAALFVFNRNKGVGAVLKKAHDTITAHPSFIQEMKSPLGEGSYRFRLQQVEDETLDMMVTLLVFNLPAK